MKKCIVNENRLDDLLRDNVEGDFDPYVLSGEIKLEEDVKVEDSQEELLPDFII